jgi:hypothetical protein
MVSCWHVTIEAQVRSFGSLCGVYGGRNDTGMGFSPSTLVYWGHVVAQLVEALHYKSEVAGLIPDGVNGIFH